MSEHVGGEIFNWDFRLSYIWGRVLELGNGRKENREAVHFGRNCEAVKRDSWEWGMSNHRFGQGIQHTR